MAVEDKNIKKNQKVQVKNYENLKNLEKLGKYVKKCKTKIRKTCQKVQVEN